MSLPISPQHQGLVLCLEDGFSFSKLTKHPPAHWTGEIVFVHILFFVLVLPLKFEAKNNIQSPNDRAKVMEEKTHVNLKHCQVIVN